MHRIQVRGREGGREGGEKEEGREGGREGGRQGGYIGGCTSTVHTCMSCVWIESYSYMYV